MPIDRLPSGRFRVRVDAGKRPNGTRRRLSRTLPPAATIEDARKAELLLRLHAGQSTADGDLTRLQDMVGVWIANGEEVRAATTQYKYRSVVSNWLHGSTLGETPVSKVRTADLEAHYQSILSLAPKSKRPAGTVGAPTVHQLHSVLTGALKWAVRMGWIAQNPATNCTPLPAERAQTEATTIEEWQAALERAEQIQPGLRALILFIGSTGCRKSEALALRWDSVTDTHAVIAKSVAVVPGHGVFVKDTKTHQVRPVAISGTVRDELDGMQRLQRENADVARVPFNPSGFIWSRNGLGEEPWRPDTAGKWITKAGVTPHMMRHMHATHLLANGVSVATVSKRLGHSKQSLTLDVYSHALAADDLEAAKIMDGLRS